MKKMMVAKTSLGWEVWDGEAFENPPLVFVSRREALDFARELNINNSQRRWKDETAGSVLTGREEW